jgi:phage terminase large subunit-like protein
VPAPKTVKLPWYITQAIKSGPVPVVRDWRNLPLNKLTRAEVNMRWIEKYCKIPQGAEAGKPIVIHLFFQVFMYAVFDNPAITSKAILSVARKNAKTAYIACLLMLFICGPEAQLNAKLSSGARSRKQAAQVFKFCAQMIRQDETLAKVTRLVPSQKQIVGLRDDTEYEALSADGATNHGDGPLLAILDEAGQVRGAEDDFFEAITTSQDAHEAPLLVIISTQAATDADWFSIELDAAKSSNNQSVVCHQYSAPEDCALDDRKAWQAANPTLGVIKQTHRIEAAAKEAAQQPSKENSFRWLHLNQRIEASAPFVSRDLWKANGAPAHIPEGSAVWLGYDLSAVSDLTAEVMVARIDGIWHVVPTFWVPGNGLLEKSREDKAPYTKWRDDGHLIATPGNTVDYDFVAHHILNERFRKYRVQNAAFDRKFFPQLKRSLVDAGMTEDELELFTDFQQGYKGMTPALRTLEADLNNQRIAHGNHPVLTMCAANAIVKEMPSGTMRMLAKPHPKRRIDGMISLAMAHGMASEAAPEEASFWEVI